MPENKTCFIIMPITTPDSLIESYRDQSDHFRHVLDCLFKPAIQKAGYSPIPPTAKGADLIHADIIKNLETSNIVLCDMSCLNPNVFFEFGIRTSLNKPVSVVKDNLTTKVPFDTGIINYHEYQSSLDPWLLELEIKKLSEHIIASDKRSQNQNTLWKYFGLKSEAVPYQGKPGADAKLDYLTLQIDSLRQKIDTLETPKSMLLPEPTYEKIDLDKAIDTVFDLLPPNVHPKEVRIGDEREIIVVYSGTLSPVVAKRVKIHALRFYGVKVRFRHIDVSDSKKAKTD